MKEDEPWGYVGSGSSEAIMCGMWNAKRYFKNFKGDELK